MEEEFDSPWGCHCVPIRTAAMEMHLEGGRQVAALSIAGSDSGGNAGLQADVRAFHTFGLHACTAVAALTAQNPAGVYAVEIPPPEFVVAQLDAILPAYAVGALKTGMLATAPVIEAVAARLAREPSVPKVVDPVMVATSGAKLIADDAVAALRDRLLPLAALVTPNLPEAEVLAGLEIRDRAGMAEAARRIRDRAGCAVLVKGGHRAGAEAEDFLLAPEGAFRLSSPAIADPASTHGTGCSLSAAIAAALATGLPLPEAVAAGKAYVYEAIRTSLRVGPAATVLGMPDPALLRDHPDVKIERA